jgi:hypothetical protein
MSIIATNTAQQRELIPAGNYIARCYQMIHIGTVQELIMGEVKTLNKVRIGWELPEERRVFKPENGEQPFVISKEFTLSMHEKSNLRKTLASWRGKDFSEDEVKSFDITKLLGVPCMLNVIHKQGKRDPSKSYEEIAGVSPLPKSVKCPAQENPTLVLHYENFDNAVFDKLPDFIKDKIRGSEEFKKMKNPHETQIQNKVEDDETSDLPF